MFRWWRLVAWEIQAAALAGLFAIVLTGMVDRVHDLG
jgi:hypothetical protein